IEAAVLLHDRHDVLDLVDRGPAPGTATGGRSAGVRRARCAAGAARSREQRGDAGQRNQPTHHDRPVASNTPHRLAARDTKFVREGSLLREAGDVRARDARPTTAGPRYPPPPATIRKTPAPWRPDRACR